MKKVNQFSIIKKLRPLSTIVFTEIAPSLNFFKWSENVTSLTNNLDIFNSIVLTFSKLSFQEITLADVRKAIKDISLDKSSSGDISADVLKQCFQALTKFSDSLKLANISPVYKDKDPLH